MAKKQIMVIAQTFDKRNQLIATARNSYTKTHPLQAHFARMAGMPEKIYLHAEIWALLKSGDRAIHRIEIFRFGASGNILASDPCEICSMAIASYGVKEINTSRNILRGLQKI